MQLPAPNEISVAVITSLQYLRRACLFFNNYLPSSPTFLGWQTVQTKAVGTTSSLPRMKVSTAPETGKST